MTTRDPATDGVIALEQIEFTYRGGRNPALRGVDLTVRPGEVVGIMGASGAGKSTLVKCLNRLVPSFEGGDFRGIVRFQGRALDGERVCDLAPAVGMVFQDFEAQLFATRAELEVAFAMQQMGHPREEIIARIGPALAAVGLSGFEHRDPTSLSGGEKQRLAIAAVLALRPRLIIFDEPTTDLDPEGRAEVLALIQQLRSQGLSLIVIEHEAEELRGCDRLMVMHEGEVLAEGPPSDLLNRFELLERCGVHPPDLNRALSLLGIDQQPTGLDSAEQILRNYLSDGDGVEPPVSAAPETAKSARDAQEISTNQSGTPGRRAPLPEVHSPLAEARGLSFSYAAGSRAIESIDLKLEAGEFLAIVGQNGSGKTTLAKQLTGLLKPATGTVMFDGRDRSALSAAASARAIGYVFQNPDHQIFAATVEDEVAFGPRNFALDRPEVESRVREALRAVNLDAARDRDPFLLSKGERQRLAVASVLALRPRLLILDEPTTGLDYREQRRMMTLIEELNRRGIAIVIITHLPWLVAEYARRVVLMRKGRVLFDGPVRDFFAADELLRESSFRPPELTILARRFGFSALNIDEFVAQMRQRISLPAAADAPRC